MTDSVLLECLERGRRVVLPGFGAFIRSQGDDKAVFSPLLTRDDGVLEAHLRERYGIDGQQARRAIEEYVEKIKTEVTTHGEYIIAGLGALFTDEGEVFRLDYDPDYGAQASEAAQPVEGRSAMPDWKKSLPDIYAEKTPAGGGDLPKLQYQKPAQRELKFERKGEKRRADTIMIVAIIAALLAIGAILYGLLHSTSPPFDLKGII